MRVSVSAPRWVNPLWWGTSIECLCTPDRKESGSRKHKNEFWQTEAVRKKNVVKLKFCLVRRCSPPRECKSWSRNIFENYSSKDLRNMYIPLYSNKRPAKQSQNVVKPKVCLLRCSPPSLHVRERWWLHRGSGTAGRIWAPPLLHPDQSSWSCRAVTTPGFWGDSYLRLLGFEDFDFSIPNCQNLNQVS